MTTAAEPTSNFLHVYGPKPWNSTRVRAACPVDGKLVYGRFTLYYDTWHLSLDCGAFVDGGYGTWRGHRGPRDGHPLIRPSRRAWKKWPIRTWLKRVERPF